MAGHLSTISLLAIVLLAASANAGGITGFLSPANRTYTVVSNELLNWIGANTFCELRGLVLAHNITDDAEFTYVNGLLNGASLTSAVVWVGGTEIVAEGNYYWTKSGERIELNKWDPGQLADVNNRCLALRKGYWYRGGCKTEASFVCMSPPA
ncbi:snaclec 1-like [Cloeon dipterum]|uniref:snaclec 1-like n=1 Tax=Cloeon dipterum TaxID=197152 RepID=UPI00321FAE3B